MKSWTTFLLAFGLVAACEATNPLIDDGTTGDDTTTTTDDTVDTPIEGDRTLPPGTVSPTSDQRIVRYETVDDTGGGYARDIAYNNDAGQDEFVVDNLPFDGDNTYNRGGTATSINSVGQLDANGRFRVYEADATTIDPLTGNVINNFTSRAIYAASTSGMTEFAIVRSGSYNSYGFGGFIYQRNEFADDGTSAEVIIPAEGDAQYLGDYAGIWVFQGRTGLNFVSGTAEMQVDFKDFNEGDEGVALYLYDRRLFDIDGNDITSSFLDAVEADAGVPVIRSSDPDGNQTLPDLFPVIGPNIADENGEMTSGMGSTYFFTDGTQSEASSGAYYAVMAGPNAEEIIGIAVTVGNDPRVDGTTYQETGGFIIYRQ